ncbi:MAG: hypothetical protein ABIY63_13370 [Fibrobacteria bacterium]
MESSAVMLAALADDLKPFQKISTAAGGFGERMLNKAAREVFQAKAWSMCFGSFTLSTVSGARAYPIPGSVTDFDGLPGEERITQAFAYDGHSLAIIPDGATGQKYPVQLNRVTNELTFPYDPGTGDKTVFYRKKYGGLTTFPTWPEKYQDIVMERAAFHCLHRATGQDARAKAPEFFNNSERLIKEAWLHDRRGQTLQEGREPQGPLGDAIWYAFHGD